MKDRLITIASFPQAIQAHIARSRLESEGIETFIRDENIVTLNWLYSNAVGGVKLEVYEQDVPQALSILEQAVPDFSIELAKESRQEPKPSQHEGWWSKLIRWLRSNA